MAKKGFIFVELSPGTNPADIAREIGSLDVMSGRDYVCTVHGKYHLVIEKSFTEMKELDEVLTYIRQSGVNKHILKTITVVGIRPGT